MSLRVKGQAEVNLKGGKSDRIMPLILCEFFPYKENLNIIFIGMIESNKLLGMETNRYSRQIVLPEIGQAGQDKLCAARILIVGAGGLGCPALQYLAAAGVGVIGIIDHDHVEVSNLQRQILFHSNDTGQPKALAAKSHLLSLNPDIIINAFDTALSEKNAPELFINYDVIIDCTDNFPTKFLINDVAVKLGKPVVYGAIQGFDGQIAVFDAAHGPCYRCLHPNAPRGAIMNCAEAGVIGALAGLIGTMQAMEAIKIIIGHKSFKPLYGTLWMIDSKTIETHRLAVPKNAACPVCSHPPAEIIPQFSSPICFANIVQEIEVGDLETMTDSIIIDVREQEEWDQGNIPTASHLPLSALTDNPELFTPHRTNTCVLYCQRGMRSRKAAEILLQAGFSDIYSLKGGYESWLSAKT